MYKLVNTLRVFILFAIVCEPISTFAQSTTTFIREMAKCNTPVKIVISGDSVRASADRLSELITRNPDYNPKHSVSIVQIDSYSDAGQPATVRPTVILLLNTSDKYNVPSQLQSTVQQYSPTAKSCTLQAGIVKAKAGEIVFEIGIVAPTVQSFNFLFDRFLKSSPAPWRSLQAKASLTLNEVQIGGYNILGSMPSWGKISSAINEVKFELSNEPGQSVDDVYFWDRSSKDLPPPRIKQIFGSTKLSSFTIAAINRKDADGHSVAVFTAPNQKLLNALANQFPNLQTIPNNEFQKEAIDLRPAKRTVVIGNGNTVDKDFVESVRSSMERLLRSEANLNILQRGTGFEKLEQELQLQNTHGATDTEKRLKSNYGVRWVFELEVNDVSGGVSYLSKIQCLSSEPQIFLEPKPYAPTRGRKESDADWAKAQDDYQRASAQWESDRTKYETEDPVQWSRTVEKHSHATANMILKLIDLEGDTGKVIWESECIGSADEVTTHRSETITVKGHKNKPDSLECPQSENVPVASQSKKAGIDGIGKAVKNLMAESLTPGGSITDPKPEQPNDPLQNDKPTIIAIDSPMVTISIGEAKGVKVGDRVVVNIYREILDPNTHEVLERVVKEKSVLLVTRVGRTSDCKATTTTEVERLKKLKVGDIIEIVPKDK